MIEILVLLCVGGLPILGFAGLMLFTLSLFAMAAARSRMRPWYALPLLLLWLALSALVAALVASLLLLLLYLIHDQGIGDQNTTRLLVLLAAGVGPGMLAAGALMYVAARREWVGWWRDPPLPESAS